MVRGEKINVMQPIPEEIKRYERLIASNQFDEAIILFKWLCGKIKKMEEDQRRKEEMDIEIEIMREEIEYWKNRYYSEAKNEK